MYDSIYTSPGSLQSVTRSLTSSTRCCSSSYFSLVHCIDTAQFGTLYRYCTVWYIVLILHSAIIANKVTNLCVVGVVQLFNVSHKLYKVLYNHRMRYINNSKVTNTLQLCDKGGAVFEWRWMNTVFLFNWLSRAECSYFLVWIIEWRWYLSSIYTWNVHNQRITPVNNNKLHFIWSLPENASFVSMKCVKAWCNIDNSWWLHCSGAPVHTLMGRCADDSYTCVYVQSM